MSSVPKKIVLDENGAPVEVIISWANFCEIAEEFGWDLDEDAKEDLRQAKADFEKEIPDAFVPLSSL
jgi:hypothetical protein